MAMGELPPKLFFRIGEVAGLVGVEPHVLRYWEREFRSIRPTKSAKGQRVYSRKDVENLLRVRDLLYRDGFTIAGAKKKLGGAPTLSLSRTADEMHAQHSQHSQHPHHAQPHAPQQHHAHAQASTLTGSTPAMVVAPGASEHQHNNNNNNDDTPAQPPRVREKLVALRTEIEAFLAELSSTTTQRR
jgi:DNA-binding transcriptional MerR regulator